MFIPCPSISKAFKSSRHAALTVFSFRYPVHTSSHKFHHHHSHSKPSFHDDKTFFKSAQPTHSHFHQQEEEDHFFKSSPIKSQHFEQEDKHFFKSFNHFGSASNNFNAIAQPLIVSHTPVEELSSIEQHSEYNEGEKKPDDDDIYMLQHYEMPSHSSPTSSGLHTMVDYAKAEAEKQMGPVMFETNTSLASPVKTLQSLRLLRARRRKRIHIHLFTMKESNILLASLPPVGINAVL